MIMSLRPPFKIPGRPFYHYEIDRKRRSLKTADKAEAMRLFNAIKQLYVNGKISRLTGETAKISLGEFAEEFLNWSEQAQPKSTYNVNRHALNALMAVEGKSIRLDRITPKSIDKMIANMSSGKTVHGRIKKRNSRETINCYIRTLKSVFQKAKEWEYYRSSPFLSVKQLPKEFKPPNYLEQKNVGDYLGSIKDKGLCLFVTALLATGRRRCELLYLDWADVDMERRRYYVRQQKTHLERWFPMSDDFVAVLQEIGPQEEGKVFRLGHPDTVSKKVKQTLIDAGFPNHKLHDLRHSFAVLFIQAEGGLRTLQELLGHTQIQTTEIYAHVADDHLTEAVNRVKLVVNSGPHLKLVK